MFAVETGKVVGLVTSNYAEEKRLPIGSTDVTLRVPYSLSYAEDAYGIRSTVPIVRRNWTSVPGSENETTASLSAAREAARGDTAS